METGQEEVIQLWFSFMYCDPVKEKPNSAVRTQAEVAQLMGLTQGTIAKIEREAFRKLRANPDVKRLMGYFRQQGTNYSSHSVEPTILRELGTAPGDASFMTISGFAPNL